MIMNNSKVMRIDGDIAKKIEAIQRKFNIFSIEASKVLFYRINPHKRGRPKRVSFREFLGMDLSDLEIQIVHNPRKKV